MPATDPEPVIAVLDDVWASTISACEGIGARTWELPTDCPGWTVRDQLSHLIGIERALLGDPAPTLEGPAPAHVMNEIGAMNEAWVAERRAVPGPEVLAEFADVTRRRLAELRAAPPERFEEIGWSPIGQVPYRTFMEVRVFDSWVHEQDIRRALGRPGGRGGPGEACTVGRVASAMPFVVGRKVRPPDGATVVFEVTGTTPATVAVEMVDGRGTTPAAVPRTPTVRLTMDTEVFWHLGCGRTDALDAVTRTAVALGGDAELGRAVLDAMNFMF